MDLFGSEHPQILYSKGILAASYNLQGLFDEAVALGRERLDLIRRELGEDHPDVAGPFSDLGDFLQDQGKYEEALDLFHKALSIHEKTLGPLHPTILKTRNGIGICSSEMTGDLGKAEDFARRLIQDYESVGDSNPPEVCILRLSLGYILHKKGKLTEAEEILRPLLPRLETVCGKNHFRTILCIERMKDVLHQTRRVQEAHEWKQEIRKRQARKWK